MSQKCIQISHILILLHGPFLVDLGARIEGAATAALSSASFTGSGGDEFEDLDAHYDEQFSVFEVEMLLTAHWLLTADVRLDSCLSNGIFTVAS
jgi:hypothetical protein